MAIPKTKTMSMPELEELVTDDASPRQRRLAVIDQILNCRDRYTAREWGMVELFYKCGDSQRDIAKIFSCTQATVYYYLERARRKALS
jgi:DNA-directed RNA polymerase specialized sigma24 family protein